MRSSVRLRLNVKLSYCQYYTEFWHALFGDYYAAADHNSIGIRGPHTFFAHTASREHPVRIAAGRRCERVFTTLDVLSARIRLSGFTCARAMLYKVAREQMSRSCGRWLSLTAAERNNAQERSPTPNIQASVSCRMQSRRVKQWKTYTQTGSDGHSNCL